MGKKKMIYITIMIIIGLLLSGCWDKVEINERAFISTLGIDVHNGTEELDKKAKKESELDQLNRYNVTYVFPNIEAKGKQGQGKPSFMVSSVGISPYVTTRELRTRLHQVMFFQHMKVLILGEDVARDSNMLKEVLDSVERNYKINRRVDVLVAKGKAKDILNVESQFEADVGVYVSNISEASEGTARFNPLKLGDLLTSLHSNKNALMPRIVSGKEDVKVAGSAIIKDFKLVGWLGEIENRSALFLKDEFRSDVAAIIWGEDKIIVPYTITESNTKKKVSIKDGRIEMEYLIDMEGDLDQSRLDTPESVLDDKVLKEIEDQLNSHLKNQIMKTVNKLQKEFKVDVIGAGDYISKYKPNVWKDIKDDWENIFPNIDIEVSVDAKIRRIGLTK